MTATKAEQPAHTKSLNRRVYAGLAAAMMVAASPVALHAEVSNAELAKEIAELKAQIRSLKGGVAEVRRSRKVVVAAPAPAYVPPPAFAAIPPGATPVFATADKKMQFGALTITPGGFLAAESVFRNRAQNRELESSANSVPTGAQRGVNESRISGRGSRAALLIEAPISKSNIVAAYGEFDFQQVAVGSNYAQSSSYAPRVRHLYATLDNSDYGLHVLAGQSFSLATLNTKGITPRNEALPPVIDYNYVAGFIYKRQGQIRVVKDFNKKLWLAVSVENSQTTFNSCGNNVVNGAAFGTSVSQTCTFNGAGSLAGSTGATGTSGVSNLSFNRIPDVIAKAAYEAKLGERDIHLEVYGMMRDFTNRDYYGVAAPTAVNFGTAQTQDKIAGSIGFGFVAPVIPRRLDIQASALIGRGNAEYATSQNADVTLDPSGAPRPLRQENVSAGFIFHATPSFDIYAFGGFENYHQLTFGGAGAGYGSPFANNSGCFITTSAGTCAGANKRVWEVSGGVWDKLYKGQFGEVRVGVNYEYMQRELFQGNGAAAGGPGALNFSPKVNDHIVYTSLRYYPFQ